VPEPELEPVAATRVTYAEFGERFFVHAVSEARIVGALRGLAGERIEFGPIGAGPGKVAKVRAEGELGLATAEQIAGEHVAYMLKIPVGLDLDIELPLDHNRFRADVEVALVLTARAAEPLRVIIDIEPPTSRDVTVNLRADGVRADLLGRLAGVDREIRRFVAKYVTREIDKPHIRAARDIDVAARIDGACRGAP
jgi:hypothetical protein